jgi:tRNA dimethylallyltransferase
VDSRQIYQDMNLGTGKVNGRWQDIAGQKIFTYKNVPHYLIDFLSPKKSYSAGCFKKDCEEKIIQIHQKGKIPILCGGTGFWMSSAIYGINFPEVAPNRELRKQLESKSTQELLQTLKSMDSSRASQIDSQNRPRIIRSIEIAQKLGKVPEIKTEAQIKNGVIQRKIKSYSVNFQFFALNPPFSELEKKIKKRLDKRFKEGIIKEVKNLQKKYELSQKEMQSFGLAYYWTPLYLKNQISETELFEKIYLSERNYAKKQLTWLKKEKGVRWTQETKDLLSKI